MPTTPLGESVAFPITAVTWAQGKGLLDVDGNIAVLKIAQNLSDVPNKVNARFNLGLVIGTDVQAYSSKLTAYAGGTTPSSFSLGLMGSADAAAFRTGIGAGSVSSVAALTLDANGTDVSSSVANGTTTPVITLSLPNSSATSRGLLSSGDWSVFNAKQVALVSGTNIKTVGSTSILGSGNIPVVTSIDITGGTTGLTFSGGPITGTGAFTVGGTLAIANGGTGATTAAGARGLLGLGTIATQDAGSVAITGGTIALSAGSASAPSLAFSASTGSGLYRGGTDVLGLATAGVSRMVVDANGNVGIGTTGPVKLLTVAAAGTTSPAQGGLTGIMTVNTDTTTAGVSGISGYNTEPSGTARHSAAITFGKDGTWVNGANFPGNIGFWTRPNSTGDEVERVRIDSSGQVGIGTTAPATLLHVDGGTITSQRYGNSGSLITRRAEGTASAPTQVISGSTTSIWVGRAYDGSAYRDVASILMLNEGGVSGTSAPGALSLCTTPTSSVTALERLRIHSSGEIRVVSQAVGTETIVSFDPGNIGLNTRDSQIRGGNNGSNQTYLDFYTSNAATPARAMRVNYNGHVGIGLTTISARLDISEAVRTRWDLSGSAVKEISTNTAANAYVARQGDAESYQFFCSGTERVRIQNDGKVGVGTTAPFAALDVRGGLFISSTASGSNPANGGSFGISSGGLSISSTGTSPITFVTSSTDRGYIQSTGNFSIGTSNDKTRLNVCGSASANAPTLGVTSGSMFISNNDNAYGILAGVYAPDGSAWIQAQRTDGTATAYNLWINPSGGHVGIGNSGPQARFHVTATAAKTAIFSSGVAASPASLDAGEVLALTASASAGMTFSGSDGRLLTMGVATDNSIYIRGLALNFTATNNIVFSPGANAKGAFTSAGSLGIGTTGPSDKLHVNGGSMRVESANYPKVIFNSSANGTNLKKWQIYPDTVGNFKICSLNDAENSEPVSYVFQANGYMGIGSSSISPAAPLDVTTANGRLLFTANGSNNSIASINTANNAFKDLDIQAGNVTLTNASFIKVGGGSGLLLQYDGSHSYIRTEAGSGNLNLGASGTNRWMINTSGAFMPNTDNVYSLGLASFRTSVVYSATGSINTSDRDAKDNIQDIHEELLDAWGDVNWQAFQFKDAILEKGEDNARWHFGLIAQDVRDAIDIHLGEGKAIRLGLVCFDEWEEETEEVFEDVTIPEVLGDDGEVLEPARTERQSTGELRVTREAGSRWGLRYDECFALESAWHRRELAREKAARLALEARLTAAGF